LVSVTTDSIISAPLFIFYCNTVVVIKHVVSDVSIPVMYTAEMHQIVVCLDVSESTALAY